MYIFQLICFSALASELKGKVMMAGLDLTQEGNDEVARIYKIEGYPTLEYFDAGKHKYRYSGENTKVTFFYFICLQFLISYSYTNCF